MVSMDENNVTKARVSVETQAEAATEDRSRSDFGM